MTTPLERSAGGRFANGVMCAVKPAFAWTGGLMCVVVLFHILAVSQPSPWSGWDWISFVVGKAGFVLPFAAFAGGIGLSRLWPRCRKAGVVAGLIVGVTVYTLSAFVLPLADHAAMAGDPELIEPQAFGPDTPFGLLRTIRHVEANPLQEYRLSVHDPALTPPNWLRVRLHLPAVMAAFAFVNILLGLLAADLTSGFRRPARRNARFAIGLAGGAAFWATLYLACHPTRDWVNVSGVVAAWLPLAEPLTQAFLLAVLVRHREALSDFVRPRSRRVFVHRGA